LVYDNIFEKGARGGWGAVAARNRVSDLDPDSMVSGSRMTKMAHTNRKNKKNSWFEVLL
jgi:hypothetical protein